MARKTSGPAIASVLFAATIVTTVIGIFFTIYFLFSNPDFAYRVAAAILVGVVGLLSFVRHSVFYRSDQARMGWTQDRPEFQLEVGYANLAIGLIALLAAGLNWGPLAYAISLLTYGTYLLCTLALHIYEAVYVKEIRGHATKSVIYTAFFVVSLYIFGFLALAGSHTAPF
jgi:hypothetical protein